MNNEKFLNNSGLSHYDTKIKEYVDTAKEQAMSITSGGRSNIGTPTETGYMRIKDGDHTGTEQINIMYNLATSDNTLSLMYETSGDWEHDKEFIIPTIDYVDNSGEVFKIIKDTTTYQEVLDAFNDKKGLLFCNSVVVDATSNPVIYALKQTDHILLYVHNHPQIIDVWKVNADNTYEKTREFVLAENQAIKDYVNSKVGDLTTLTTTDQTDAVSAINEVKFTVDGLGEPYRLKDFTQTFSTALTIPSVTQDIANTSIPNVDISITGQEATDFAIAGLLKYEVFDASNNRLNCFPVCSFSMDGQKTLRVRMMVGGPNSKSAKKISGAILLKHR